MVIRIFRAIVHDGKQNEFEDFFLKQAVPHVKSQSGLIEMMVGKPHNSSPNEFLMTMIWKDLESVKKFAGKNWQQAVILEDEKHLLKEVFVHHYESLNLEVNR